MKKLYEYIDAVLKKNNDTEYRIEEQDLEFCHPFTKEADAFAYLLSKQYISYDEYRNEMNQFNERHKFLHLYEMAPRTFGETWCEKHIIELFPEFLKANKRNLKKIYPSFSGEFDLWFDGIRVEVKACRSNSNKTKNALSSRAYSHDEAVENHFEYHYQQLKPTCCDVFIWIGVCCDTLLYWVLTSDELLSMQEYAPQHRKEQSEKESTPIYEGQVFLTEEKLKAFLVPEEEILEAVKRKGKMILSENEK